MHIFKNNVQLAFLIILIAIAVFFRFWDIRDYVVFLGDEGRDMIVIRNIFVEKNLPFLGPTASVGGFYLGPIYYWMAAPFLLLWRFDPVGPSYMVAIFGVATVFLLYKLIRDVVGFYPALFASLLYSTAPLIVRYSRSSWNPNPLPFFSLLLIYCLYQGIKKKKLNLSLQSANWWTRTTSYAYFLGAGASFGVAIQLHYLASILLAIAGLIILVSTNYKNWLKIASISIIGFLITFSPFLIFEIRHNFPNFTTIIEFVTRGTTAGFKTVNFIWLISNIGNIFLEEISQLKETIITKLVFWSLSIGTIIGLYLTRKAFDKKLIFSIGIIWFIGGILGLRFYTGQIYDYYFGFMFPAPFLLIGIIFYLMWDKLYLKVAVIIITSLIFTYFVANAFYKNFPNRLIDQTENVADFVIDKSSQEPYNFALISDSNSDHAYRYFLEIKGYKPIELETMVTEQLLIVCESKKCQPLGHPIWEIAGFGRGEIDQEWNLLQYGITVIRLTHWPGASSPAGKPAIKGE